MKKNLRILLGLMIVLFIAGTSYLWFHTTRASGKPDGCTITQYADASGKQGMFYLIRNPEGVIVVDSGWADNEAQVRSVLKENGNVVNAWILTHPHPDHMGAFNPIWQNPDGIEIQAVYTVDMDYEVFKERAQPWDSFEVFDTFVNITSGDERIHYLYAGNELDLCGLHMKVLSAYDDKIAKVSTNIANDGSLMFKLTNKEESILFCADVGKKISKRIIKNFKDDLKSDYIQMGHHGNGGLSRNFYKRVKPHAAFFDAPEWLMHPEDESLGYTTPQNAELMESLGAQILSFNTAPNTITLK